MTYFPNAPAPQGALFDDAPVVQQQTTYPVHTQTTPTWYVRSDTSTLTPATRIAQIRGGKWVPVDVMMQYGRPVPLELALKRVAIGRTVFVAREDAAAVLEAVRSGE